MQYLTVITALPLKSVLYLKLQSIEKTDHAEILLSKVSNLFVLLQTTL